jgi:hypothetical protein
VKRHITSICFLQIYSVCVVHLIWWSAFVVGGAKSPTTRDLDAKVEKDTSYPGICNIPPDDFREKRHLRFI